MVSTASSKVDQIWLWHRQLGHPPISLSKKVFPALFENFDYLNFHCQVCFLAKHHRVSFSIKNPKCLSPFSLIHSNVCGLSRVPNHSGSQWFVTIGYSRILIFFMYLSYIYLFSPFSLIHSNVCGPSHVPNHSGSQWFVTIGYSRFFFFLIGIFIFLCIYLIFIFVLSFIYLGY